MGSMDDFFNRDTGMREDVFRHLSRTVVENTRHHHLTEEEHVVLLALAEAWDVYNALPDEGSSADIQKMEFMQAIHMAQYIVLSRPTLRAMREEEGEED